MLSLDARIVLFLFFAFVTGVLFILRRGSVLSFGDIIQIVLDFLLVPSALITVGLFVGVITRTDPMPLIRQAGYQIGLQQLVSFSNAIPANLDETLAVQSVERLDTDGDGFREWVVYYQFDLQSGRDPIEVVIYDNDRGNPPVIFPYALRAPDRNYLGEGVAFVSLDDITEDSNGPNGEDLSEILVEGPTELTMFRFRQNSAEWDFPRDAPARYEPIGFFRGNGGVEFDRSTKEVSVIDRNGFERSQLAIRSIYGINPATETYLDSFDASRIAAPIISTIDFYQGPPSDINNTAFPEKVVLAFYASTCGDTNKTLCNNADEGWSPSQFLASNSDAFTEYNNGNAAYFGLPSFAGVQTLSVTHLRYYPQLETDQDLLVSGGGRDVVTGEEAQFNIVDIYFVANGNPLQTARFEMGLVNGQWKIIRGLSLDLPELGAATQISTP
ncbi:MAG: hypothetical protein AAF485_15970 [Chloroflexota bacterium]